MRVLLVGGNGQVGHELRRSLAPLGELVVTTRDGRLPDGAGCERLDLVDLDAIGPLLERIAADVVVNAAAYTAVDRAEDEPATAFRINAEAPARMAEACAQQGCRLVHYSTDYVFDGTASRPYREDDPTSPLGVYGASKLAGEQAVLASGARAIILRTSWVYSPWGRNFVRTMLNAGKTRDRLTVVADQKGCPTTAGDLADAILAITTRLRDGWREEYACVYHAAGSGWTTWHGLAVAVFEEGARHGQRAPVVDPIATADWPTPAKRPADSRLDCTRLAQVFGVRLPDWRSSVGPVVDAILGSG